MPMVEMRIAPKPVLAIQPQAKPSSSSSGGSIFQTPVVLSPRRAVRRKRRIAATNPSLGLGNKPTNYQPSHSLPFKQFEGRYFELFRIQTACELSGYFNSTFWAQRVLQECHSELAIRHAVIALGALYNTLEQSFHLASLPQSQQPTQLESIIPHWQVAVKQYSEACNAMLLLKGESIRSFRTRLMASILLACFDSFIGDHKQAIVQIQSGLGLLAQLQKYHPNYRKPSPEDYIEDDLLVMFTRLAIQAKSYDMAFHFPQPYVIRLATQSQEPSEGSSPTSSSSTPELPSPVSLPTRFESLVEARLAGDRLNEKLLRFIERLQMAKNNPSNVLPASWKQYGMALKGEMESWAEAFAPIFESRHDPKTTDLEKSGIAALKMFQINGDILFLMMFCDTEVKFDAFLPQFKTVVELGWEAVQADEKRAATDHCRSPSSCPHRHTTTEKDGKVSVGHVKPSFSADLGIVPPLYVVATKCRDPRIRRQAVQLLRSSARREGMWDSELAANIGQWVMEIEEFDGRRPTKDLQYPTNPIPEERRVMVKSVDFDLRARVADIRVGTRALYGGMPDARLKATRITW